jgi:probable F420-dependent oxidoreductase
VTSASGAGGADGVLFPGRLASQPGTDQAVRGRVAAVAAAASSERGWGVQRGFGVPVAGAWATPENQVRLVRRAEELGYRSAWTFQRLLVPARPDARAGAPFYRAVHDAIVTLAYLAGQTSRIRLGLAVANLPFFSPALLAKQLATLDAVSDGRLDVGLGLGWMPEEFEAVGVPMPQRGARAEEFVAALRALWTDEVVEFHGRFYRIPPSRFEPKPLQRPHPPVLLGGNVPSAWRRAGRLADGWVGGSMADLTRLDAVVDAVRQGAGEAGRDPDALRFVCRGVVRVRPADDESRQPLSGSLDEIRGDLDAIAAQGVTEVFFDLNFDPEVGSPDVDPAAAVRRAEEVLEALAPG